MDRSEVLPIAAELSGMADDLEARVRDLRSRAANGCPNPYEQGYADACANQMYYLRQAAERLLNQAS